MDHIDEPQIEKATYIDLEILNWNKYNPRRDIKRGHWFRFENEMIWDDKFHEFSHSELVAWIYLLCLASKSGSGRVRVWLTSARRLARLQTNTLKSAFEKLQRNQCIKIISRTRTYADVTDPYATGHNNTNNTVLPSTTSFTSAASKLDPGAGKKETDVSGHGIGNGIAKPFPGPMSLEQVEAEKQRQIAALKAAEKARLGH